MARRPSSPAARTAPRSALRALGGLALAASALVGASACSPITTLIEYAPSDGVRAELGDEIGIQNLLVLTEGEGEPALVVGAVTNHTDERLTVTMTFAEGLEPTVVVMPGDTVLLDPMNEDGAALLLPESPAAPGATIDVTISTPSGGTTTAHVPVLDGTLAPYGEYIDLIPELLAEQPA